MSYVVGSLFSLWCAASVVLWGLRLARRPVVGAPAFMYFPGAMLGLTVLLYPALVLFPRAWG